MAWFLLTLMPAEKAMWLPLVLIWALAAVLLAQGPVEWEWEVVEVTVGINGTNLTSSSNRTMPCACIGTLPTTIPRVACSETFADDGYCVTATGVSPGQDYLYPASYGAECKVHADPGDSRCWDISSNLELLEIDQASFCREEWCFVDPCSCPLDDVVNVSYFNEVLLFRSYSNCAGTSNYTTGPTAVGANCTTTTTTTMSTTTTTVSTPCACIGELPINISRVECTATFATDGYCVSATGLQGQFYPVSYGAQCGLHKEPGDSQCWDLSSDLELSVAAQASTCLEKWCFVDPCTCLLDDVVSVAHFDTVVLFRTVSNCAGAGNYTAVPVASANCPTTTTTPTTTTSDPNRRRLGGGQWVDRRRAGPAGSTGSEEEAAGAGPMELPSLSLMVAAVATWAH